MKHSIQWRLQFWHGGILLVALLAFGWAFYRSAWREELRRVDEALADQFDMVLESTDQRMNSPPPGDRKGPPRPRGGSVSEAVENIRAEIGYNIWRLESRQRGTHRNDYYLFLDHDGTIFARSTNAPGGVPFPENAAAPPQPRPSLVPVAAVAPWQARSRGDLREVYRVLPLGDAIIIGRQVDGAGVHARLLWLAAAGLGLLAAGLVGGWWFTRQALAPIGDISRTATEIAAGDLSRRVAVETGESELGQLAGVLNHTFDQLQAAFERQQRFTSDASHELRTPISVILSKTQTVLNRERPAADYRDALEVCQRAAKRMRALTESLLALSRMDAQQEQIGQETVDLARVAEECLDFLSDRAEEHGITLERELAEAPVRGDASRLAQVVTNLVSNAIQYTPSGGQVTVRTKAGGGEALLEVADTGIGLAPEDAPRVFDRFYRADKSRTGANGSGLGLSIARSIVEAHHGAIGVASAPGQGATFWMKLPARQSASG